MKKLIVFGATGGTGKEVVNQALQLGYPVTAFVRNPDKLDISHANLNVFQGDVLDAARVTAALEDQQAVVCCIGAPASDKTGIRERGTANILNAMKERGVERLVCLSSLGVGDSKDWLPWYVKHLIVPLFLKNAFADHAGQERVVEASKTDWTIVRPVNLTDGERTGSYKVGFGKGERVGMKISRADVAELMVRVIGDEHSVHRKLGIAHGA